jgi:hypothetical protein
MAADIEHIYACDFMRISSAKRDQRLLNDHHCRCTTPRYPHDSLFDLAELNPLPSQFYLTSNDAA